MTRHDSTPHLGSQDEGVFGKEEPHGACCIVQWLDVHVYGGSLGRDMGIVAEG
jgi:hypothetical protein